MGDLSTHFSRSEFVCRHCRRLPPRGVVPELIVGLEALRALAYPGGLIIDSGYRCSAHNRAVGGATGSQHLYGAAADVTPRAALAAVKALKVFSGLGWQRIGGRDLVRHVDVRHASGHNGTRGTTTRPTTWEYLADGTRR
jgi:hypothetical protein